MELANKIMKNDQMHLWVAFNADFNVHLKSLGRLHTKLGPRVKSTQAPSQKWSWIRFYLWKIHDCLFCGSAGLSRLVAACLIFLSDLEDNEMQLAWLNGGEQVLCVRRCTESHLDAEIFPSLRCQCRSSGFERQHRRHSQSWTLQPCNLQESLTRLYLCG